MEKLKNRIIFVLLELLILGGAYFGVLATEQKKRLAVLTATQADVQMTLSDLERFRQEYFVAVELKKAELSDVMDMAKSQYDTLRQKQPAMIEENKKGVSVPITKTVTVQLPKTSVATSKPKSTRTTKTS